MSAGSPTPEEKVDHVEDARELLRAVEADGASGGPMSAGCALAQAHAQLAIAEELRGIREALRGRGDDLHDRLVEYATHAINHHNAKARVAVATCTREAHEFASKCITDLLTEVARV